MVRQFKSSMSNTTIDFTRHPSSTLLLWIGIQSIVTFFVVVNNMVVLLAYIFFPKIRNSQSNLTIANLAITDLMLGILVLPWTIHLRLEGRWVFSDVLCSFYQGFLIMLCQESIFSTMILCVDKYFFIKYPLQYYTMVTRRRLVICTLISWMASAAFALIPSLSRLGQDERARGMVIHPHCFAVVSHLIVVGLVISVVPLLVMFYTNYYTLRVLKNHVGRINPTLSLRRREDKADGSRRETGDQRRDSAHRVFRPGEIKVIKAIFLIAVVFLIVWLPLLLTTLVNSLCHCTPLIFVEIFHWLAFTNSALNPLLYAYKGDFRRAYSKIMRFKIVRSRDNEITAISTNM